MGDTLFDLNQYQPQAHISYSADWRDATGTEPAWEQPDLEPDLGTNPQEPDGDALNQWRSGAEFTLTIQSGQTVEVTFVPCLVGNRRMHEFSFTGSVSPTGFKSHFVLAVEAEKFPHPRDYAQAYTEKLITHVEDKQDLAKNKKPSRSADIAKAPQERTADNDNSLQSNAMPEKHADVPKNTSVEVVEELSPEEAADRQRLELKVEKAFYIAGVALRELRDRRLYRNTHKSWKTYCLERFGYGRDSADLKILAASVVDNLNNLPTNGRQVRAITSLKPNEQRQVWDKAVEAAGGSVPSARVVKDALLGHLGVVERPKQHPSPREFAPGDVVEIKALKRSPLYPFNGMWAVIEHVGSFSYTVRISIARDTQQCKAEELTLIDDEYTADIKAVGQRIAALVQFELEPVEYAMLQQLQASLCFTPGQLFYLKVMEQRYGICANE